MGAEDGHGLTFEYKILAALGKKFPGWPLSIVDPTLPMSLPAGQDWEALALPLEKVSDLCGR